MAAAVGAHADDHVACQSLVFAEVAEGSPLAIQAVEPPTIGADPIDAAAVLRHRRDVVGAQALGVVAVGSPDLEPLVLTVELIEA